MTLRFMKHSLFLTYKYELIVNRYMTHDQSFSGHSAFTHIFNSRNAATAATIQAKILSKLSTVSDTGKLTPSFFLNNN